MTRLRRKIDELQAELEMQHRRVDILAEELANKTQEIDELRKENMALQMDIDIYESVAHAVATRKAAEIVNGIMAYETESEPYNTGRIYSTYKNDAEMFAEAYEQSQKFPK